MGDRDAKFESIMTVTTPTGTDAKVWADEFVATLNGVIFRDGISGLNELLDKLGDGWATTWFAAAIETGRDAGRAAPTTIPLGELKQVTYVSRMATPSELTDEVERLRERVAALEAVLAEPTEEVFDRLCAAMNAALDERPASVTRAAAVIGAILADLRQRAGV